MKVMLVIPRQSAQQTYQMPLGIGYISACLKRAGHEVIILNPNHHLEPTPVLLQSFLTTHQPQVVGFGGMALHLNEIKAGIALTRQVLPHAFITVGGPLVSNQPEPVMTYLHEADVGMIGEGEHTAVELCAALEKNQPLSTVNGLIYRVQHGAEKKLKRSFPRPIEENLDVFPWCDYEGLGLDIYAGIHLPGEAAPGLVVDLNTRVMPLLTSRGCPYPCTFCCHEEAGRRYRNRSLDDVFAEIQWAMTRFGINALFIYDDLFCLKRSRLEEFCKRIAPLHLRWQCSMSVGQIDPEILALMKSSGCVCISIGVESMSPTVLTSMRKKTTREKTEKALAQIYEAGIALWSNLIFGDPAETLETARESLEWMWCNPKYNLRTALIGYHPGARIYQEAVNKGLIQDPIQYLVEAKPEINGTTMSDAEYDVVKNMINRGLLIFGQSGRFLNSYQEKDYLVAQIICPHCGQETLAYLRPNLFSIPSANCQHCNRKYRTPIVFKKKMPAMMNKLIDSLAVIEETQPDPALFDMLLNHILQIYSEDNRVWIKKLKLAEKINATPEIRLQIAENIAFNDPYNLSIFEYIVQNMKIAKFPSHLLTKYHQKIHDLKRMGITHSVAVEIA